MGKKDKRQKPKQNHQRLFNNQGYDDGDEEDFDSFLPTSAYNLPPQNLHILPQHNDDDDDDGGGGVVDDDAKILIQERNHGKQPIPSKFLLYQNSVQTPKGDISYLQKFFLVYVGGRFPLHLQEDFCGTALLSVKWLHSDSRRTAVGLDLDHEALTWCLENNLSKVGADGYSRLSLFHGNVLQPHEATFVKPKVQDLIENMTLNNHEGDLEIVGQVYNPERAKEMVCSNSSSDGAMEESRSLPARDIVCAFNYSCCCLQKRRELVLYFRHVFSVLSRRGGIFVMDLYGGTSSEKGHKLQRRFPNFTYIWEQEQFDIVNRTTRISLHFHLGKNHGTLRHAFSYYWRLWSLPEIKDCLEEAGFQSVHFWMREMPDTHENAEEFNAMQDIKYEEVSSFQQTDAWNAYVVAVAN